MKKALKPLLFIIFLAAVFALLRVSALGEYLEEERLRAWVAGFGVWAPLVYILIYSVAPSLLLPGLPITIAGGVLFGPFWGVVYTAIGATIGASVAFLIARRMGGGWVEGLFKKGRFREIYETTEREGWKIVAFTRLIPLFPYNFLNFAFGLTRIKFTHYALATFFFMLPGIIAYVVFSSSILALLKGRVSTGFVIGLALVVILSAIAVIYKRRKGGARG